MSFDTAKTDQTHPLGHELNFLPKFGISLKFCNQVFRAF
jgi:hypothetical protein